MSALRTLIPTARTATSLNLPVTMRRGIDETFASSSSPVAQFMAARSVSSTTGSMRTRLNEAKRRESADAAAAEGPVFSAYRSDDPTHVLHVQSTRNNVVMSYTDCKTGNKVMRTITAGTDKDFKKSNRSSYEAAHQAALKMFGAIKEQAGRPMNTRMVVAFKGMFGQGREAVSAALLGPEGSDIRRLVVRVEDRTPIKIGGTRAKRPRRL